MAMKSVSIKSSWIGLNPSMRMDAGYWVRVWEIVDKCGLTAETATVEDVKAAMAEVERGLKADQQKVIDLRTQAGSLQKEAQEIERDTTKPTKGWSMGKVFYEMSNVGKCKYLVNFHDGVKTHKDGSEFFDIRIFKNKKLKNDFVRSLMAEGYRECVRSIYQNERKDHG